MAKCKAKTTAGAPCKMAAIKGTQYCFNHSPDVGPERAQARKRGGENRYTPHFADPDTLPEDMQSLADVHELLKYIQQEVIGMDNTLDRARILLGLADRFIKKIEIGELEQRIAALEARRK
jgi:hypothetical protein